MMVISATAKMGVGVEKGYVDDMVLFLKMNKTSRVTITSTATEVYIRFHYQLPGVFPDDTMQGLMELLRATAEGVFIDRPGVTRADVWKIQIDVSEITAPFVMNDRPR